jgi:transcriptional regulator with XRE-family HTH domain
LVTDKPPYPNRLAVCMKAARMTDPGLANLAGTTKQQIFKLRRGERNLTVQWAQRLAPHLKISWQQLIDESSTSADPSRANLLATYDAMNEEQRRALLVVAKVLKPDENGDDVDTPEPVTPLKPRSVA